MLTQVRSLSYAYANEKSSLIYTSKFTPVRNLPQAYTSKKSSLSFHQLEVFPMLTPVRHIH